VRSSREGSHGTQAARTARLTRIAADLRAEGYKPGLGGLKPKHVDALVARWQRDELNPGTIKNRMSDLRWWSSKTGKAGVVRASNDEYGIPRRQYVASESKARTLPADRLALVTDTHVHMSLRLQAHFGLRREECLKFAPSYADRGGSIVLKGSWCKGGRPREIPVRTAAQRAVLNEAHRLAGGGSMIPPARSYVHQLRTYERQTAHAGLEKNHGLRHHYAQARYYELLGWAAPAAGGPTQKELTASQREQDRQVREYISEELGHNRTQITTVYLGR